MGQPGLRACNGPRRPYGDALKAPARQDDPPAANEERAPCGARSPVSWIAPGASPPQSPQPGAPSAFGADLAPTATNRVGQRLLCDWRCSQTLDHDFLGSRLTSCLGSPPVLMTAEYGSSAQMRAMNRPDGIASLSQSRAQSSSDELPQSRRRPCGTRNKTVKSLPET